MRVGEREAPCSTHARVRGDDLVGTAPPARRWLVIEHPGPWRRHAIDSLPAEIIPAVSAVLDQQRARLQLVRRPGRSIRGGALRWWVIDAARWVQLTGTWEVGHDLTAAIQALGSGLEEAAVADERLVLVCAHGMHDQCCAVRGRPVASVLAASYPASTWETTHLGGDRFASNLCVLPGGVLFGQVDERKAVELVESVVDRRVSAEHFRGMTGTAPAVQAVLRELMRCYGPGNPSGLRTTAVQPVEADAWTVALRAVVRLENWPHSVTATVRRTWGERAALTCQAAEAKRPPIWRVEDLAADWTDPGLPAAPTFAPPR